ncbi:glycosyltransferase family 2 protein [Streptomyces sp. N2-109]|uniref:Glycosyltransferase family 2 protein n=1 Tax=Streptomyces gossypii TaxID=2883101 RepID=A0ABT2K252_9ACTN|nr:glycosyltransferase family 2 protein [Streptomyces gossypii]MCT2593605.1 glycosyltransferase family 2 protein [Streptomyces gossypii]
MSVHSHSAAQHGAATAGLATPTPPAFPRHVVTAVLVSHDGARWLPEALAGLSGQERPVQDIVAADTGSADESAGLLTDSLGPARVLHMARRTGFGTAVEEAVRATRVLTPDDLPYLKRPSGWDPATRTWRDDAYDMPELPYGEPVQWLWLLHDDCAPEPDALERMLHVVDADPSVMIAGPKLRSWYDQRQLLEAGVTIAHSGRRWTGIERREQDQGQHDQVRPVLAVSTAGMLIRRDVFEQLGGFDRRLPLMRDDVDLCWRAHSAGHRVLVVPDAVLRHAEAASRERRPVDCVGRGRGASPHRVDKAGAVYTLLANSRTAVLPWVLLRLTLGTLLRTLAYLVGKVPGQALDEVGGLFGTLLRPLRLTGARRARGKPVVAQSDLRGLFPPPGATVRATAEQIAGSLGGRSEPEPSTGGRHGAVESGPGDDDADFLEVEQFARLKRLAQKPGPLLFGVLLLVSLIACRSLLGGGALAGGALLPAPGDVGDLWAYVYDGWHPVGTGSTEIAPPYLGVVAALATLLFGSTGLALTLLLVCSVPLAGLTAYFASRPLAESRLVRAWASVAYAFLPAATGALAGGRIGTAVLAITLPLLARTAVAASGLRGTASWRAAWGLALLLSLTTAFTPVVWPIALVLALVTLALPLLPGTGAPAAGTVPTALRALIVLATPLVLLAPWSTTLLGSPSRFLDEAGLPYGEGAADAVDLLTLTPGGPGTTAGLLLAGVVLAALAALLRADRRRVTLTAWVVALTGLLFAALSNGSGWAGPATLVYGLALLSAAAVGADGARERVASRSFGWQQPVAGLIAVAAVAAPLIAAVGWMSDGADGPLSRRDPVQVPAFVAEESGTEDQPRTLVLAGDDADGAASGVSYTLVRGSGARLGDAGVAAATGEDDRLSGIVANLVAGSGADQTSQLGGYAIRYVLVRDGAPRAMSRVLDATPGLTRLSQEDGSSLWSVAGDVSRVSVVPGDGAREDGSAGAVTAPVPVDAGPVEAHTKIDSGPDGRVLRIADAADAGWKATLDGKPLKAITVDGWAQGFELTAEGGRLDLTYETPLSHTGWVWARGVLAVLVLVLALPGRRREIDDDLPEVAAVPVPEQPVAGEGRRARRLRAAAETAETQGAAETADAGPPPVPGQVPYEASHEASYEAPQPDLAPGFQPEPQYADYASGYGDTYQQPYEPQAPQPPLPPQHAPGYPQQPYDDWQAQQHGQQHGQPPAQPPAEPYGYDAYGYDAGGYEAGGYEAGGYDGTPYGNRSEQQ